MHCLGDAITVFMRVQQLVKVESVRFLVCLWFHLSFEKSEKLQPKEKVNSQKLAYLGHFNHGTLTWVFYM